MEPNYRAYLVVTDPLTESEIENLVDQLNSAPLVADWLGDIPNTYYIASSFGHQDVSDFFQEHLADGYSYLVTLIHSDFVGMLSNESWQFIKKYTPGDLSEVISKS